MYVGYMEQGWFYGQGAEGKMKECEICLRLKRG